MLLGDVVQVFEDFRYTDQVETGDTAASSSRRGSATKELQGVDVLRFGEDGLIKEMMVMVRPASGLMALGEEMGRRLAAAGS